MKIVSLNATSEDGSVEETVELVFDHNECSRLEHFLTNCERLEKARILLGEFPSTKIIKWEAEKGLTFEISDFEYGDVCELLHLARPVFLSKEPASFERTQAIFGKKGKGTAIAQHIKNLRKMYERGDYQPYFQVSVNDVPLFHDETIKLWLNGVEYHQDHEKAKIVASLQQVLSENVAKGVFVSQLAGRIRATFMLADLARLVVKGNES